jgi:hypothetical protein
MPQAIVDGVDRHEHLILFAPLEYRQHRPENLFLGDAHLRRNLSEDGGLDVEPVARFGSSGFLPPATSRAPSALPAAI